MKTNSITIAILSAAALLRNPTLRGETPLNIFLSGVSGVNFGALAVTIVLAASTIPFLGKSKEAEGSKGYPNALAAFSLAALLTSVIMLYFKVK